ncbi:MAG TPA: glycoside hydrolase family 3 N-terminal domain-containing protein, partial [Chthoniobacteraceae bacterium]|nr:glycoside hydrolase family 3 N-terminal domain-containing protein [Chthoniobacteraceae bacterium]
MKKSLAAFLAIVVSIPSLFGQATDAPIKIEVPYVQYLKLKLDPPDLNNNSELTIQNTDKVIDLKYADGTQVTVSLLDFRGDYDLNLSTDSASGVPLKFTAHSGIVIHVKLTAKAKMANVPPVADAGANQEILLPADSASLDGSKSQASEGTITSYKWAQVSGPATATIADASSAKTAVSGLKIGDYKFRLTIADKSGTATDDVEISVKTPAKVDFQLLKPAAGTLETTTRKPTFTWDACPGATKYELYLNITRTDYDWYASGNLLDRYTKVGETAETSFTLKDDLVDRWTYKWYVVATTPGGPKYSNKLQFGVYLPVITQEQDGIPIVNGCRDLNKDGTIEPYEDWHLPPEKRVDDLMGRLTLEEKVAQLFYGAEGKDEKDKANGFSFSYGVENGMRDTQHSAAKTRMGIPVAFLGDKIHGWKTIYPTELGMAAMRDMDLVYQCGNMQRVEEKSFGFTGALCPLAEVDTKVLYPRFQEGCGENAEEAAALVRALVCGMQGGPEPNPHSMMITVKHWPSQGAGGEDALQYDAVTIKYHMKPWIAAVDDNATSVMPGYNHAPFLDPSNKGANASKLIIDYLRKNINFKGFIVTDWLAANTNQSIESLGAGVDVMGGSPSSKTDPQALEQAIGIDRINEACRRVLDIKFRLGMFENPYGDPTCTWTKEDHHALALKAAEKSVTLLKNDGVLPLKLQSGDEVAVGGPRATWPIKDKDPNVIWQSIYYDDPQAKTYLQAITERGAKDGIKVSANGTAPKVAVVVIGEQSYTHGTEWKDKDPNIPADQLGIIQKFHDAGVKVITVVISPRPYILAPVVQNSDAVMLVYRGGTGIGQATAACIFGD